MFWKNEFFIQKEMAIIKRQVEGWIFCLHRREPKPIWTYCDILQKQGRDYEWLLMVVKAIPIEGQFSLKPVISFIIQQVFCMPWQWNYRT